MSQDQSTKAEHSQPDFSNESKYGKFDLSSSIFDPTNGKLQNRSLPEEFSSPSRGGEWISQTSRSTERKYEPQYPSNQQASSLVRLPILSQSMMRRKSPKREALSQSMNFAMRCYVPGDPRFSVEEIEEVTQRLPSAFDIRLTERVFNSLSSPTAYQPCSNEHRNPPELGMGRAGDGIDIPPSSSRLPLVPSSISALVSLYSNAPTNYARSIASSKSRSSTVESTSSSLSTYSYHSLDSGIYMAPQDRVERWDRYICYFCSMPCIGASQLYWHRRYAHGAINSHVVDPIHDPAMDSPDHYSLAWCDTEPADSMREHDVFTCGDWAGPDHLPLPSLDLGELQIPEELQGPERLQVPKLQFQGELQGPEKLQFPKLQVPGELQISDSPSANKEYQLPDMLNSTRSTGSPEKIQEYHLPLNSPEDNDSSSSFSEYETDWEEDDPTDHFEDGEIFATPRIDGNGLEKAGGEVIDRVLSPMQQALLDRMMTEFWIIFKQENDFFQKDFTSPADETQCCETETGADSGDTQGQPPTEQSSAREAMASDQIISGRPDLKRKRAYDKSRDDADDERNQKRPRRGPYQPKDLDNILKFACPYRKYNPNKYSVCNRPKCALTALETVARVKAHLYRDHRIFPCDRCKQHFNNHEEVVRHLSEPEGCELRDIVLGDGLTSHIVEKLKSRKKSDKYQSESDRWREIYTLLFPLESYIPDPCFEAVQENILQSPDSIELANYEEYCRQQLPRIVRNAIQEEIRSLSAPIEDDLRNRLVSIVRDCQDRMFLRYRESRDMTQVSAANIRRTSAASITISSVLDSERTLAGDGIVTDVTEASSSNSLPSFLQPPPHNDMGSQQPHPAMTISDVHKPTSDSGYASSFSELLASSSPRAESGSFEFSFESSNSSNSMFITDPCADYTTLGNGDDSEWSLPEFKES